jgi:hypothetical protein
MLVPSLDAAMPPWAEDGGMDALYKRLSDPVQRAKIAQEIRTPTEAWENLYLATARPIASCWSNSSPKRSSL